MTNCEENLLIETNPNSVTNDQQSRFKVIVLNNEKIRSNTKIVQKLVSIEQKKTKTIKSLFSKEIHHKLGFTVNTDNANYMEDTQTGRHSYSFQIVRDTVKITNLENLLIQSNSKGGYDAYIIQYGFTSVEYAKLNSNSIKNYRTSIYSIDFDTSTFKNGTSSKMAYGCTAAWEWKIIKDGDKGELVGAGNEDPFEEGWVLTNLSCGYYEDGTGNNDGQTTNLPNTTNTSGGGSSAVIAAPNTVTHTSQLKNFESGFLSIDERNYYHSDPQSNIKSTIDWYLIKYNFSETSKSDAKSALNFGDKLNLNFQQFNWVFNNRTSQKLQDIIFFLVEVGEITPEIDNFLKEVIISQIKTNNSTEVDFDAQIINSLTGKALCIYNKLKSSSLGFSNSIKKFDGEFPVSHLKFTINNDLPSGNYGVTNPPDNFIITIELSNTQLANISDLGSAISIAHEIIHAEIFRKLLSAAKKGDLNTNNYTTQENINFVNSLRNNFPGLYDYYYARVHKYWNHDLMAQHYRSTIADIAQQYDNNRFPRQIYEDLAWAGLREIDKNVNSIAWNKLPTTEQERIKLNIINLFHNGTKNCN